MIRRKAEYEINPESRDIVEGAIGKFVDAVHAAEKETEYVAYRVTDTDQYLHIMKFADEASQLRHQQAEYTLEFVDTLYPNCTRTPEFSSLGLIA